MSERRVEPVAPESASESENSGKFLTIYRFCQAFMVITPYNFNK
jgi:hypothetical protein